MMSYTNIKTHKYVVAFLLCLMSLQVTALGAPPENLESEVFSQEKFDKHPRVANFQYYCGALIMNYSYAFSSEMGAFPYTLALCRREINDHLVKINLLPLSKDKTLFEGVFEVLKNKSVLDNLPLRTSVRALAAQFFRMGFQYSHKNQNENAEIRFQQATQLMTSAFAKNPDELEEFYINIARDIKHEEFSKEMYFVDLRVMLSQLVSTVAAANKNFSLEIEHREILKDLYSKHLGQYLLGIEEAKKIISIKERQENPVLFRNASNKMAAQSNEESKDLVLYFERHELASAYKDAGLFEDERRELEYILKNSNLSEDHYRLIATRVLLGENSLILRKYDEALAYFKIAKEKTLLLAKTGTLITNYFGPSGGGYGKFPEKLDFKAVKILGKHDDDEKDWSPQMFLAYIDLQMARTLREQGKAEWFALFEKAFPDLERGFKTQKDYFLGFYGSVLVEYADALMEFKEVSRAADLYREAVSLLEGNLDNPYQESGEHPLVVKAKKALRYAVPFPVI